MGKFIDMTGWVMKEHGVPDSRLTVINYAYTKNDRAYWKCKCECGNEIIINGNRIKTGGTKSCGCINSFGKTKLYKLLTNKNINFNKEYTFKNLISSNGGKPRFDFAILNQDSSLNCLIEYQGIQHYDNNRYFGEQQRKETDQLKKDYCKENNILLYEIRYDKDIETKLNEILNKQGLLVA